MTPFQILLHHRVPLTVTIESHYICPKLLLMFIMISGWKIVCCASFSTMFVFLSLCLANTAIYRSRFLFPFALFCQTPYFKLIDTTLLIPIFNSQFVTSHMSLGVYVDATKQQICFEQRALVWALPQHHKQQITIKSILFYSSWNKYKRYITIRKITIKGSYSFRRGQGQNNNQNKSN